MPHRLSRPVSFLRLDDDDDDSLPESSRPTPRTSFIIFSDSTDSLHEPDLRLRPHSLFSVDSGYYSMTGKEPPLSRSKSFTRKPSAMDLRPPLLPINGSTADATHESPKREGAIRNFLRKKKKSTSSRFPPDFDPFSLGASHRVPVHDPALQIPSRAFSPPRSRPRDPSIGAFEQQDRFVVRQGMKHHPYPRDDAPYMLAYDRTLLDNDRFSEILLRRLNHNHSPSFHDFVHASPKTILDLGCGSGLWPVEAAEFWPSSQVIGFDLVDPARLRGGAESPSNVKWIQGNFVKYKLPFPKNMFDLVRMANLSLCIPRERWEHVLSEARRVLAQGGRLELIDDYLYFPYTKGPPQPPGFHDMARVRPSSFDGDGTEQDADTERRDGEGINDYDSDHDDGDNDDDDDEDDDDDFVSTKSRFSTLADSDDLPPYDLVVEWNRNLENSKSLEKLFEDMLSHKFSVDPRPSKFIDNTLDKVFGRYNQSRLHDFNLYLAPGQDSDDSSIGSSDSHGSASLKKAGKDFTKWMSSVDWDHHKEKKQHDRSSGESIPRFSMVPEVISPKAAGRLGIKPAYQSSHPSQSPGLILWPSTFIPIAPFELEMHTCKHLHSLIGSKAALSEYLQDIAHEQNLLFDQQMVDDLIWDYESFRRRRFNWPSEFLDSHPEPTVPFMTTPRSNTFRNSQEASPQARPRTGSGNISPPLDPLFPREKLDFVRCIKVYSATKSDDEIHVP